MKRPNPLLMLAVLVPIFAMCGKKEGDTARVEELERRVAAAEEAKRALETRLEQERVAAAQESVARERERLLEEKARAEADAAAQAEREREGIRAEEAALKAREEALRARQEELTRADRAMEQRGVELGERERELAGREMVPQAQTGQAEPARQSQAATVDLRIFHEPLSSHGWWFESPEYGFVWQPSVAVYESWRPYTMGRWVCSDRGWLWVSEEPFGWAVYHYGRWARCRGRGWVWVPGTEWAPAWVCWRSGGQHVGWAPLPPETIHWSGQVYGPDVEARFAIGSDWFVFIKNRNFCRPVKPHCLPWSRHRDYWKGTVGISRIHWQDNKVICGGPRYEDVRTWSGGRPPFYRVEEDRRFANGNPNGQQFHRVENDRIRVTAPLLDGSGADARPRRVLGRLDRVEIDRSSPLPPDVVKRVEESRKRPVVSDGVGPRGGNAGRDPVARREEERLPPPRLGAEPRPRTAGSNADSPPRAGAEPRNPVAPREEARPLPPRLGAEPRRREEDRSVGAVTNDRPRLPGADPVRQRDRNGSRPGTISGGSRIAGSPAGPDVPSGIRLPGRSTPPPSSVGGFSGPAARGGSSLSRPGSWGGRTSEGSSSATRATPDRMSGGGFDRPRFEARPLETSPGARPRESGLRGGMAGRASFDRPAQRTEESRSYGGGRSFNGGGGSFAGRSSGESARTSSGGVSGGARSFDRGGARSFDGGGRSFKGGGSSGGGSSFSGGGRASSDGGSSRNADGGSGRNGRGR
jgi:hypothetical protein